MSEVTRRWGPGTAAPEPSIEDLLEPIALEARLAEARIRRTQVLAAKYGKHPSLVAGASPARRSAPGATLLKLPPFLIGLAAGAAALGLFSNIDPFAAGPTVASAPPAVTMWHDLPPPPVAYLLPAPFPLATGHFRSDAPAVASGVSTGPAQAPTLSAPAGEAAEAAPADNRLRPLSRVRAGLTEIVSQPLVLVRERVAAAASPETPTSHVLTAVPPAPVSRAAMRPASAPVSPLVVVLPVTARELPAGAHQLPLDDGPSSYEPPMLCYPGLCYLAFRVYASPARPSPALPAAQAPQLPVALPARQPTAVAEFPRIPPNPSLGEVPTLPAARAAQPFAGAPNRPARSSRPVNKPPIPTAAPSQSFAEAPTATKGPAKAATRPTQGRGASNASVGKGSHSLSSDRPGRSTSAHGRSGTGDSVSRSASDRGKSQGNSGKGGSASASGKSGGGNNGGGGNGKGGSGGGKGGGGGGKGSGRH